MIKYSREDKKYFLKRTTHWIVIATTNSITIPPYTCIPIDTSINIWLDNGTVGLLSTGDLPPVLQVKGKPLRGKNKLVIDLYNSSDKEIELTPIIELSYLIPLASAYYSDIELSEVNSQWWLTDDSVAEI